MLKIICNIRIKKTNQEETTFELYNCQPCQFSDFHFFSNKLTTAERIKNANRAAAELSHEFTIPNTNSLVIEIRYDIDNYNKIFLMEEGALDAGLGVANVIEEILTRKNTKPSKYIQYLDKIFSSLQNWFFSTPVYEERKDNLFVISRKKFSLVENNPEHKMKFTNDVDSFFLYFLKKNHNFHQCIPLQNISTDDINNTEESNKISEAIYNDYKDNLPRITKEAILFKLSSTRMCIVEYDKKEIIWFQNDIGNFDSCAFLTEENKHHENAITEKFMAKICNKQGGKLTSIPFIFNYIVSECEKNISNIAAELHGVDCSIINNLPLSLLELGSVDDFYIIPDPYEN